MPSPSALCEGQVELLSPAGLDTSLLLDSGVLRDQSLNECRQQRLASLADVVYKLEEPEVEREFLLGNAPMRTTPAAQQRPKAFHRISMDFTQTVAIFIACE